MKHIQFDTDGDHLTTLNILTARRDALNLQHIKKKKTQRNHETKQTLPNEKLSFLYLSQLFCCFFFQRNKHSLPFEVENENYATGQMCALLLCSPHTAMSQMMAWVLMPMWGCYALGGFPWHTRLTAHIEVRHSLSHFLDIPLAPVGSVK